MERVLIVVELLELAVLDPAQEDGDLVRVEFANHFGLLSSV